MRPFHFLALTAVLFLVMGLAVSCGDDDDDDTGRQGGTGDDDDSVFIPGDDDADDDGTSDDDDADDDADDDVADDDNDNDLTWQEPPSDDLMTWEVAVEYCEDLSFGGHDDWRLPTINELRSLIRGCEATELGGSCGVTDSCTNYFDCWDWACTGCEPLAGPAETGGYWPDEMTGEFGWYWSPVLLEYNPEFAWYVGFASGDVHHGGVSADNPVRCVR